MVTFENIPLSKKMKIYLYQKKKFTIVLKSSDSIFMQIINIFNANIPVKYSVSKMTKIFDGF